MCARHMTASTIRQARKVQCKVCASLLAGNYVEMPSGTGPRKRSTRLRREGTRTVASTAMGSSSSEKCRSQNTTSVNSPTISSAGASVQGSCPEQGSRKPGISWRFLPADFATGKVPRSPEPPGWLPPGSCSRQGPVKPGQHNFFYDAWRRSANS